MKRGRPMFSDDMRANDREDSVILPGVRSMRLGRGLLPHDTGGPLRSQENPRGQEEEHYGDDNEP